VATATQTSQTLQASQPVPNRIPVFIPDALLSDLIQMYEAIGAKRAMGFDSFVSEIVVERIVHFRSLRIKPSVDLNFKREGENTKESNYIHQDRLSPQAIQQILHLRHVEGVSTHDLAKRFRCSRSTIRRFLAEYERREHNPSAIAASENRIHGDPATLQRRVREA
jgi:hypothetical protein